MFTIGLTGGIASGKNAAANFFQQLGVPVIDSDIIAREIVQPELAAWQAIKEHFGPEVLRQDQTINRPLLREIIFADKTEKQWLENLLHPAIRDEMANQLDRVTSAYAIMAIPLLVESKPNPLLDRVLVIDAPNDLQLERLVARDNCTVMQGLSIIASQASREQRLAAADDVIDNTGSLEQLKQAVYKLHQTYLSLAQSAEDDYNAPNE